MAKKQFRSGFVSIIGRPNAGKSTLLNALLGEKISIVSKRPQTTRNVVRGIKSLSDCQMIFLDTPGIHRAKGLLNKAMVKSALNSLHEADLVVYMVDAGRAPLQDEDDSLVVNAIKRLRCPVILCINKADIAKKEALLPLISGYAGIFGFKEVFPISALKGWGVQDLVSAISNALPEGPRYFPDDIISDQPERFIVAEIIREKVFLMTRDEVPYSTAVVTEEFKEREAGAVAISAVINVERDTQKAIIIGRQGAMLKAIGTQARLEIQRLLGARVYLRLFVKARGKWRDDERALKEFGYCPDDRG
jgi:GTP-binding protein Era